MSYVSSENYCSTAKRTQIWHFSCFTFNQRYNLQRKNWNHKSLGGGSVNPPAPLKWRLCFMCRLSWSISSHFVAIQCWKVCCIQKFTKNFFGGSSRSRSSMLINLKSLSPVFVMISSMSVPICNRFHTIEEPIWSKITSFRGDTPFWRLRSKRTPHPGARHFVTKN